MKQMNTDRTNMRLAMDVGGIPNNSLGFNPAFTHIPVSIFYNDVFLWFNIFKIHLNRLNVVID